MFKKMLFTLVVFAPGCTDHVAECNKAKVAARDAWGKAVEVMQQTLRGAEANYEEAKVRAKTAYDRKQKLGVPEVEARDVLREAERQARFAGAPSTDGGTVDWDHPAAREFHVRELTKAYQEARLMQGEAYGEMVKANDDVADWSRRIVGIGRRRDELDKVAKSAIGGAVAFRDKVVEAMARSDPNPAVVSAMQAAKPVSDKAWEVCKDVAP